MLNTGGIIYLPWLAEGESDVIDVAEPATVPMEATAVEAVAAGSGDAGVGDTLRRGVSSATTIPATEDEVAAFRVSCSIHIVLVCM